ncbi:DUF1223 domain-containing protein [Sphingopyxis sp. BSNA05]|uniref:DUF1223 domain-containing protein n=1 Tax=Sphingopyxis sp. BSNA05 TaxID=1236614 RepID=UPI001566535F|nr:DUF1223 domain-containing protein [Sphingopyxis sp. BSNA05]NRD88459.1 DUF1223 domain-containing protein [Sphingopyxis sp. BSNA05]
MSKIIMGALIGGSAFAGIVGAQLAPIAAASAVAVADDGESSNPVVIELFTSQGCSSCPPADMLARRLAKDGSLLVITRSVTYWDRLGWKDTLAREENTRLQRAYAAKGNEGSGVYTPQMVVNGAGSAVGSRENDVRSLVRRADRNGPRIGTSTDSKGRMIVTISGRSAYLAGVSLIALSSSEIVRVGRGENGGRTMHYVNVVKAERNLGSWRGKPARFVLSREDLNISGADRYAIIVQRPGAGPIVAAKLVGG